MLGAVVGTEPAQHLVTVELRQVQIEQHDRGQLAIGCEYVVERLDAIAHHHDLVRDAGLVERPQRELLVGGVVLRVLLTGGLRSVGESDQLEVLGTLSIETDPAEFGVSATAGQCVMSTEAEETETGRFYDAWLVGVCN